MIELHDIEQGTQAWHEAREGKYTGSNADKLLTSLGAHEYAKAIQQTFSGNFATKRGHTLEPEAIKLYERINNVKVDRPGYVTNSDFPDCLYSPDGLTDDMLLEVKCFDDPQHLKLIHAKSEHDIPLKIRAQVHFGMLITGRRKAHLLPYNPRFAKKFLPDGSANPDYSPKLAFKIITIKVNRNIQNNFKQILTAGKVKV